MNNQQDLDKVTDYFEDKGLSEQHLTHALSDISAKTGQLSQSEYKLNEKDAEFLINEFFLERSKALKILRNAQGDLKKALLAIIQS